MIEVTRTYLELRDPSQLNRKSLPESGGRFVRPSPCPVERYRELYRRVGDQWHWRDRLAWSDERLAQNLARSTVAVWELLVGDALGGYFELELQDQQAVEIVYFGLTPEFIGKGFGGAMLTKAADEGFAMGAKRVWLHTCTLDSPHALANYKARGFKETGQVEKYIVQV
jgi:ribosomal protein S18 acetylase RimI-like enzyme